MRDFAYPVQHPHHYGPPPESQVQSRSSTPLSDIQRRLSEPAEATWEADNAPWSAGPWAGDGAQLPSTTYGEGPPYSEDEDLHSPVVVSSSHKKQKSSASGERDRGKWRSPSEDEAEFDQNRGYFAGTNGDGSETYYDAQAETDANGPGGELVTYPPYRARQSLLAPHTYSAPGRRDSHFAGTLPSGSYRDPEQQEDSDSEPSPQLNHGDSRYSKDYQFTIASPDEEMHGKAVALFDFTRENENELPLVEGQVIWVSYRQLQGWLVAQDPKTGESGLVPEEYVRLLRDIEGEWPSIAGEMEKAEVTHSPILPGVPPPSLTTEQGANGNNNGGEKRPPIVSTFSTSSKDLDPYPHRLPAGQTPPAVAHYGSQTNTPTVSSPPSGPLKRGPSQSKRTDPVKEEQENEEEETSDDSSEDE